MQPELNSNVWSLNKVVEIVSKIVWPNITQKSGKKWKNLDFLIDWQYHRIINFPFPNFFPVIEIVPNPNDPVPTECASTNQNFAMGSTTVPTLLMNSFAILNAMPIKNLNAIVHLTAFLRCSSCHIQNVLIGIKCWNCCRTLDVYLLFATLLGQIYQKLNYRLVTYKLASP